MAKLENLCAERITNSDAENYLKHIGGVDIRGKSGSCELQAANALLPQIICIRINAIKSNRIESNKLMGSLRVALLQ